MTKTRSSTKETSLDNRGTSCDFCGRLLGNDYYYSCLECGATYCYVHMTKHSRAHSVGKEKNIQSTGRVLLAVSTPKKLEEAFGVDGDGAIEVAKMISAYRREEIGH